MRKLDISELNRLNVEEYKDVNKLELVVILDNIRSLNNIGSVFRTSDAFLVKQILLCGITATPPNRDIHKTALGATESVEWKYFNNTLDACKTLKNDGYQLISIEQVDQSIQLDSFPIKSSEKYALILGNEVKGIEQKVIDYSDIAIELPQFGTKHSLNISVCAGIVLWEFCKHMMIK